MSSLTVLRLRSRDLNLIERQMRAKVTQFPQFFQSAPVVLDVSEIEGGIAGFPLAALVRALHVCRVVPVAVTNIDEADRPMAAAAGLGIVTLSTARPAGDPESADARTQTPPPAPQTAAPPPAPTPAPTPTPEPMRAGPPVASSAPPPGTPAPRPTPAAAPGAHRAPLVVRQPVRSGQLIYGEKNDVIVLAPVNPGAQVVADGNIHIYAPMRGRAVAGANGYTDARIFCQRFEAELIAIAGSYLTFDDIPRDRMGKPAMVYLQDGKCVIAAL